MAYIGSPPANRVLSSADIAQGAVTLNDINFTDQPSNMDITGVIDKHTMRLADGVTVTGDVTISDDLVLSKISDDGNAITMTNDGSTRTITGSGSIEASTLSQTPNASLTGMTGTVGSAVTNNAGVASGTIGSVVTGSPNLNLGNASFPAGHVIQSAFKQCTANLSNAVGATTVWDTDAEDVHISGTAGNTLFVQILGGRISSQTNQYYTTTRIRIIDNSTNYEYFGHGAYYRQYLDAPLAYSVFPPPMATTTHLIRATGDIVIKRGISVSHSSQGTSYWEGAFGTAGDSPLPSGYSSGGTNYFVWEIQA